MRLLPLLILLAGCAGDQSQLLEQLALDECEVGTVEIRGEVSTGPIPVFSGTLYVSITEERTAETLPAHCRE